MADSRLTFDKQHLDNYIKTVTLGPRSAAVGAGTSIPFALAAEATRPILAWNEARYREEKRFPPSLLTEIWYLNSYLGLFFDEYVDVSLETATETIIVVAGFFSDNTPGLARIVRRQDRRLDIKSEQEISIWRPRPGGRAYVVIGDASQVPVMAEAVRRSRPPQGRSFHDFGSVLWDIIKDTSKATSKIGGGLAFGFVGATDTLFHWPIVDIEGRFYCRGLAAPLGIMGRPFSLEYKPRLFSELMSEHSRTPFSGSANPEPDLTFRLTVSSLDGAVQVDGERRLTWGGVDDWLIQELDARAT